MGKPLLVIAPPPFLASSLAKFRRVAGGLSAAGRLQTKTSSPGASAILISAHQNSPIGIMQNKTQLSAYPTCIPLLATMAGS